MPAPEEDATFGIVQLDNLSLGTLSPGTFGLISGPAGTGKSSILAHFLFKGAREGRSCCLITDEPPSRASDRLSRFRSFDRSWLKDGYISIFNVHDMLDMIGVDEETTRKDDMELLFDLLAQTIEQLDTKRLVVDPLNPLVHMLERTDMRFFLRGLRSELIERGAMAMLSYDTYRPVRDWGFRILEPDVMDVIMELSRVKESNRSLDCLAIERWRGSPHSKAQYVIDVDQDGIVMVPRFRSEGVGGR